MHGRVTVMILLILSKSWHTLRLVTFTQSELESIQSIMSSLANRNAKIASLSFATFIVPRSQGGLNLLNPAQQTHSPQWRWLQLLLHPNQLFPFLMSSLPVLRFTLFISFGSSRFPSCHWSLPFSPRHPICLPGSAPVFNIIRARGWQISRDLLLLCFA